MRFPLLLTATFLALPLLSACSTTGEGSAASTASGGSGQGATADAVAANSDPRVCKVEAPTGSRIGRKVCKRRSQWQYEQDEARRVTEDAQRKSAQTGNPVGS